jgi:hypothetical protein
MSDSDSIVDEVRRVRAAHAARFNYDLRAIFNDIKEQQKRSGLNFVSFSRDGTTIVSTLEPGVEPNQPLQPTGPAPTVSDNIPSQQAGPAAER